MGAGSNQEGDLRSWGGDRGLPTGQAILGEVTSPWDSKGHGELAILLHSHPEMGHLRQAMAPMETLPCGGVVGNRPTAGLASWQMAVAKGACQ